MNIIQLRWISTSAKLQGTRLIGPIINKVFNFNVSKKKRKNNSPTNLISNTWKLQGPKLLPNKRVTVLNRIFMRSITDLISTGEIAPTLVGKGIEITRTEITNDFNIINVYWFTYNNEIDENNVQELLNACTGHLQHELAQLKIISNSPVINFVKDKRLFAQQRTENFLDNLKFQDEWENKDNKIPHDYVTTTSQKDDKYNEDEYEIALPEMKQNVMGFDQHMVMNKIKIALKKAQNHEKPRTEVLLESSIEDQKTALEACDFLRHKEQKQIFDNFLKQNKLMQKKQSSSRNRDETKYIDEFSSEDSDEEVYCDDNDVKVKETYEYYNSEE